MISKISTVIPVHISCDEDMVFLDRALESLRIQTFQPLEVILSVDLCPNFIEFKDTIRLNFTSLNLLFLEQPRPLGISQNTNQGLQIARGDFVHVLHQDDLVVDSVTYEVLSLEITENKELFYLLSGKRLERDYLPHFDLTALVGNNQIGGPSGCFFPNFAEIFYDEELTMLLDVEFVFRLRNKFGSPRVIEKICIQYGVSNGQAQNSVTSTEFRNEVNYVLKKLKISKTRLIFEALLFQNLEKVYSVLDTLIKSEDELVWSLVLRSMRLSLIPFLSLRRRYK